MNTNTGITLVDVRSEALDTIRAIKEGSMDLKQAAEIRNQLNMIINVAKTQVDFLNAIPKSVKDQLTIVEVKAIAGTLTDRDAELDSTLHLIKEAKSKPISLGE